MPHSKGKGKAIERAPLLDGNGNPAEEITAEGDRLLPQDGSEEAARLSAPRAWRSHLLTAALVLLTLSLGLLLGIILLVQSYAAPALQNINGALSQSGQDGTEFWKEAVLLRGPDAISVVSMDRRKDESGVAQLEINVSVTIRMAVDTDFIMSFREGATDDTWWTRKWKELGRWSVRLLGSTTAVVDKIIIYPSPPSAPLANLSPISPIHLPLNPGLSAEDHTNPYLFNSLKPLSIPLLIRPSQNASLLLDFAERTWAQGFVCVQVHMSSLLVYGGHEHTSPPKWWQLSRWRNWLKLKRDNITLDIKLLLPTLHFPSDPPRNPGSGLPALSDLLILESFNITSSSSPIVSSRPLPTFAIQEAKSLLADPDANDGLVHGPGRPFPWMYGTSSEEVLATWNILISARASLAHPFPALAPKLNLGLRPLPFTVALPVPHEGNTDMAASSSHASQQWDDSGVIPVTQVYASPTFNATHILIAISGYVLPLTNSPSSHLPEAISNFVSSYLSYKPSPIAIYSPLYPTMVIRASFPPPPHRLELLRDVEIENMRIHAGMGPFSPWPYIHVGNPGRDEQRDPGLSRPYLNRGTTAPTFGLLEMLASATIHARVVLPRGMDIDIRVARVWVDCLIFDGEVPSEGVSLTTKDGRSTFYAPARTITDFSSDLTTQVEEPPVPIPLPLPMPLPPRAFARITPKTWLNATSSIIPTRTRYNTMNKVRGEEDDDTGTNVYVTAEIDDVPLVVLPGREGDLSRFVTKVLFSKDPVVAGIRGVAAVRIGVPGLTSPASSEPRVEGSELTLTGLPFEGNVKVGGRSF